MELSTDSERLADVSDVATRLAEVEAEYGVAAVRAAASLIEKGNPGICYECERHYTRLVGGLCGFCRDGRTPP